MNTSPATTSPRAQHVPPLGTAAPKPRKNSRAKGVRGELAWRDELRAMGFCAERGQQHAGGRDSPDVRCPDLPNIHFEVKNLVTGMDLGTRLFADAVSQALYERGDKAWCVAWKPQGSRAWRVTFRGISPMLVVTVCGEEIRDALLWLNAVNENKGS